MLPDATMKLCSLDEEPTAAAANVRQQRQQRQRQQHGSPAEVAPPALPAPAPTRSSPVPPHSSAGLRGLLRGKTGAGAARRPSPCAGGPGATEAGGGPGARRGRPRLGRQGVELLDQRHLPRADRLRQPEQEVEHHVAPALGPEPRGASAAQHLRGSRLRRRLDHQGLRRALERGDLHLAAEQGLPERQGHVQVHVVVDAPEALVGQDLDGHEEVAGLPAPRPRVASARDPELHEVADARGDAHSNVPGL
mmetsp:Transcript_79370/g.233193  ORF Transcript_79370/g.233193 Transcript_79370/m.233193 type:complete len:250 (-) Transcript_79370:873-1622(-)